FPDPDLPALRVSAEQRRAAAVALPELPWAREARFRERYGLPAYDAAVLNESRELGDYYEASVPEGGAKLASNWVMTELLRVLNDRGWSIAEWASRVPGARFRAFLARVGDRTLPGPVAKQVFAWLPEEPGTVDELLARHGVAVQSGEDALRPLVRAV